MGVRWVRMKPGSALGAPALAAAAALAAWTAPSRAAAGDGMELVVSLAAGAYVPTRDNGFIVNNPVYGMTGIGVDTLRPGVDLELALSAWWGVFGAQVGVGYLTASWEQTSVGSVPVTALLRLRLPLGSVAPYLEGGAGVCFTSATTPGPLQPGGYPAPPASFSATTLEWVAGVGADLDLGPLRLGAAVRYVWVDPNPISAQGGPFGYSSSMRFDLDGLTATVNVGYRFPL